MLIERIIILLRSIRFQRHATLPPHAPANKIKPFGGPINLPSLTAIPLSTQWTRAGRGKCMVLVERQDALVGHAGAPSPLVVPTQSTQQGGRKSWFAIHID